MAGRQICAQLNGHIAAGQGHDRRTGQRQRGHDDVTDEVDAGGQPGMGLAIGVERRLLRFQRIEAEKAAEVERKVQHDERDNGGKDGEFA